MATKTNLLKAKLALKSKQCNELANELGITNSLLSSKMYDKGTHFSVDEISKIKEFLSLTDSEVVDIFLS